MSIPASKCYHLTVEAPGKTGSAGLERQGTHVSGHSGRHSQRNYLQRRSQCDVNDDLNKYQLCSSHCSYPFWQAYKNSVFLRFLIVGQRVRRDKRYTELVGNTCERKKRGEATSFP